MQNPQRAQEMIGKLIDTTDERAAHPSARSSRSLLSWPALFTSEGTSAM